MSTTDPQPTRDDLLRSAFATMPQSLGDYTLRRMGPFTYSLMVAFGNPLLTGKNATMEGIMDSVAEYVWLHSASEDDVIEVSKKTDLPEKEIRKIGLKLDMGEALSFFNTLKECSLRMAAALTDIEEEDEKGKPEKVSSPTGSPPSSSPSEPPVIPFASATSSSTPLSSEPSSSSLPTTSPTEPPSTGQSTSPAMNPLPQIPPSASSPSKPTSSPGDSEL